MRSTPTSLWMACVLLTLPALTLAATIRVDPDGSGDFTTIQPALNAAVDGDEVVLASGTYTGPQNQNLVFAGKRIVLRSETGDPGDCVLGPDRNTRAFLLTQGETRETRIEGIQVRDAFIHGSFEGGSAAHCYGSSPTFRRCEFRGCYASRGSAVLIEAGSPRFEDCTFRDNLFSTNTYGGAMVVQSGSVEISGCWFDSNSAVEGGAIWTNFGATLEITGTCFLANIGLTGGAICCRGSGDVRLTGCTFYFNLSSDDAQIHLSASQTLHADRTLIASEASYDAGQAVICEGGGAILSCCAVFGHAGGDWVDCLAGQELLRNNLWLDPRLCNTPYEFDPSLRDDSPCAAENNCACGQIGALGVACAPPIPVGACCRPDGTCLLLNTDACDGVYLGDEVSCCPLPCEPTAIKTTSWGRIKAAFR